MTKFRKTVLIGTLSVVLMSGCAQMSQMDMGNVNAKTMATGAAAGGESQGANSKLEHCDSPLGTISLVENQAAGWYTALTGQYRLPPTSQLLRLMVQQSNCFVVVERSAAGMSAMQRERALMAGGQMRQGSQMDGGQMVASDYAMSPEVIFNDGNTGGAGGGVGGRLGGGVFGAVAAVAGSVRTSEASVMLTLVDNRSGVQVSASEGSAKNSDFAGMGALFGSSAGGTFGAYSRTPQGKVIAASFMDAYNNMVKALRNYKAQTVKGQGLGGGGRLGVDGGAAPSQTRARQQGSK
jgi:Curli production assembly/transport component CsgG